MVRMNITMPEIVAKQMSRVPNKSRFIAEAVREKLERMKGSKLEQELIEGYQNVVREDQELNRDWDVTITDGDWS